MPSVISDDGIWNPMLPGSSEFYNPDPFSLPGTGGGQTVYPSPTPSPVRQGDISNAGLVNPTLFDNQANNDWWVNRYYNEPVNQPHRAMDFDSNSGGDIWGETFTQTADVRPVSNDAPSFEWDGGRPTTGEPIIETPTDSNPLPLPPDEPLFADITNRDLTPLELPEEEEFLWGNPDPFDVPSTGPSGGSDIRSFGNNLTLGEFLNTPLSTMRYGEGYPDPVINFGGRPNNLQPGEGYIDPQQTGGHFVDVPGGQQWVEDEPADPSTPGDTGDETVSTSGGGPTPTAGGGFDTRGMTIVGYDTVTGAPIYRDASGQLHVPPGTGTPVFDPSTQYYDSTGHVRSINTAGPRSGESYGGNAYGQGAGGADKSYMNSEEIL